MNVDSSRFTLRVGALRSEHKRIAVGAAWIASFVLLGKMMAAGRDMALAWRFGLGEVVDAYQLAQTFVLWIPSMLVSTVVVVLVPTLVAMRHRPATERDLFARELHGASIVAGGLLGLVGVAMAPWGLPSLAGNLSPNAQLMASQLVRTTWPVAALTVLAGVYGARLMARGSQLNTLLEAIPPLALMVCVLLWPAEAGITPLVCGIGAGIALQTLWLAWLSWRSDGSRSTPTFSHVCTSWPEFARGTAVLLAGQVVMGFVIPVDQYSAGGLGSGAIAALTFANRLVGLLLGLGAVAFARAALPVMAELAVAGQAQRAHAISMNWAGVMLGAGVAVAMCAWPLAPWGVEVLFERGAFGHDDTELVCEAFRWGLLQVPFYFTALVFVQLLASRRRYDVIALLAATNLVVKVALNLTFVQSLGIRGLALATGLMYAWSSLCLYCAVERTSGAVTSLPDPRRAA